MKTYRFGGKKNYVLFGRVNSKANVMKNSSFVFAAGNDHSDKSFAFALHGLVNSS